MPVPSAMQIEELQREPFNTLPGMVNARRGSALAHALGISQDIQVTGRSIFEYELAQEATWALHNHPCHVHFASNPQGGFTSTPRRYPEKSRQTARFNPATYPPGYEMKVAMQEFHKLHEHKINKLKGGYSATANLIFQSCLKDINVHVED